jgi:ABC-type Fe3+ transport system substrate-binding protein
MRPAARPTDEDRQPELQRYPERERHMGSLSSRKRTLARSVGLLSVVALTVAACGGGDDAGSGGDAASGGGDAGVSNSLEEVIAAAEEEGEIQILGVDSTIGGGEVLPTLIDLMNKKFGTNIELNHAPGPSISNIMENVATEQAAGQASSTDILVGSRDQYVNMWDVEGWGLEIPWEDLDEDDRISEDMLEDKNFGVNVMTGVETVVYNTDAIPADEVPASLEELLDPKWTGRIATTPYASGFRSIAAPDLWGYDDAMAYMEDFSKQVNSLVRCAAGGTDAVLTGAADIFAMECVGNHARLAERQGAPIAQFVPTDAAMKRYFSAAVPSNATNPNAATLLALTMVSEEGQKVMWDMGAVDLDTFPESGTAEVIAEAEAAGAEFFSPSLQYMIDDDSMARAQVDMQTLLQRQGIPEVE